MVTTGPVGSLEVRSGGACPPGWRAYVDAAADATFCHRAEWGELMADVFGHEPLYLTARAEGGEIAGVLPLVRMRSRWAGHHLVSMPFLNYGGPLGGGEARKALTDAAVAEAHRSNVARLELRCRGAAAPSLPPARAKLTVLLPLPAEPDALFRSFPAKLRSQLRRPLKSGLEARIGPEQAGAFYAVYARNLRDLGTPVHPRRFFEEIARVFADRVTFAAVYRGDEPVAGGCGLCSGDEFELTWAASLRAHSREAPNMLLYWTLMAAMIRRGVRVFNFGRCTPGGGPHRFKQQWGGVEERLPWVAWPGGDRGGTETLVLRGARAVWRRLPLAAANRLGPRIMPGLPWA